MNISIILLGLLAGILSGAFGIGGGVVIVPALVLAMGFDQRLAQGTSLAMFLIAPSILGTITYFRSGNVDLKSASMLWVGAFIGTFISAYVVNNLIPDSGMIYVRRAFCILIVMIAVRMWFSN
ncbi:MAG: TSUP family transporter [Brevinema sp.]